MHDDEPVDLKFKTPAQKELLREKRQHQLGVYRRLIQQEARQERLRKRHLDNELGVSANVSTLPKKKRVSFIEPDKDPSSRHEPSIDSTQDPKDTERYNFDGTGYDNDSSTGYGNANHGLKTYRK